MEDKLFSEDGECNGTREIICPKCGHENGDSWEYTDSDDDMECDKCGAKFSMEREVDVTYTTRLQECNNGNGCAVEDVEYDHRMMRDSKADYSGKCIKFVPIPEEEWKITDIWTYKKCGTSYLFDHPYTKEEDPRLVIGLHGKPMAPYSNKPRPSIEAKK